MTPAMTPGSLRKGYSLAIAVLVHAILVVLMIGVAIMPRSAGGPGGEGVGLELVEGDSEDSAAAPEIPLPPTEIAADAPPLPPLPSPAQRMSIRPGGTPGGDLYLARVRAHLARFRRELPPDVRSRGVVELRFKLSARGEVTQARIAKSSGDAKLDDEALNLLTRAAPLPSRGKDTELIVPIEFKALAAKR
jgi:TonB family protein